MLASTSSESLNEQVLRWLASASPGSQACVLAFQGLSRDARCPDTAIQDVPGFGSLSPRACRLLGAFLDDRIRLDRNDDHATRDKVDALLTTGPLTQAERSLAAVLAAQFRARHAQRQSPFSKFVRADLLAASFRLAHHAGATHDQSAMDMALDAMPGLLAFARHVQRHHPDDARDFTWLARLASACSEWTASRRHFAAAVLPAIQQEHPSAPACDVPEVARALLAGMFDLRPNARGGWAATRPMRCQSARLVAVSASQPVAAASLLRLACAAMARPQLLPVHDRETLADWAHPLPAQWDAAACRAARAVLTGHPWRLALAGEPDPLSDVARAWDARLSMVLAEAALSDAAPVHASPRRRA